MDIKKVIVVLLSAIIEQTLAQCDESPTTVQGTQAPGPICSGALIFEENFDGPDLDLSKWKYESSLGGGGNGEFQWYSNDPVNSNVDNGILSIKPSLTADDLGEDALYSETLDLNDRPEGCTNPEFDGCVRTGTEENILNPVKSALILTIDSFSFCYGRVEVRAKVPEGDWLWPAIWMLPKDDSYGTWPVSGEIDIMESRGNANLEQGDVNIGVDQVSSTLHWGINPNEDRSGETHAEENNEDGFNSDFHTYEVIWTPDSISFAVDGNTILEVTPPDGGFWEKGQFDGDDNPWSDGSKMAPFDKEFYLIINLAIGGTNGYFPDDASNPGGKPWDNNSPTAATDFWNGREQWLPTWNLDSDNAALEIDYVRVYAL